MGGSTSSAETAPPSARAYPAWLEQWWLARAAGLRGRPAAAPEDFLPSFEGPVRRLSDLFTVARPGSGAPGAGKKFPDYHADAELAAAYGLFFFPQNFVRARLPLAEAMGLRGWRGADGSALRPVRVLDLGAGAGAAGLGAAMLVRERASAREVELTAVDRSAAALTALAALARDHAAQLPGLRVKTVVRDAPEWVRREGPREAGGFDLIVLGFALNEFLPAAQGLAARLEFAHALRGALAEHGLLLLLEPALRETAEPLQELSDALCADRRPRPGAAGASPAMSPQPKRLAPKEPPPLPRWGPYLGDFPCPLRAEGKFWNHEVRAWTAPGSLEFLNRKLWRDLGELKFSCALHGRAAPPPLAGAFAASGGEAMTVRLVSPWHLRKGGFVAAAVTTTGRKITLELPTRGLSRAEIAAHEKIERGDVLALRDLRPVGGLDTLRLAGAASVVGHYTIG